MSFCVQFEKVGRGLLREGERREGEWAVLAEERGMKREYRSWTILSFLDFYTGNTYLFNRDLNK